jgi:hypothetical protein
MRGIKLPRKDQEHVASDTRRSELPDLAECVIMVVMVAAVAAGAAMKCVEFLCYRSLL